MGDLLFHLVQGGPALAEHRVQTWRADGRSEAECRARLADRGVPEAIIDQAVRIDVDATASENDPDLGPELKSAIKALGKAMGSGSTPPSAERLASRLGRRGFEPDTIQAAMRHYGLDDLTSDSSEDFAAPADNLAASGSRATSDAWRSTVSAGGGMNCISSSSFIPVVWQASPHAAPVAVFICVRIPKRLQASADTF